MSTSIAISTHRLPLAGRLRDAFEHEGYEVDFVPSPDQMGVSGRAELLILTGEKGEPSAQAWVERARGDLGIPVFASFPGEASEARGRQLSVEEALPADPDPEEVVLLAARTVERRELQRITGIVGEADAMREALERVVQIAPVDSTVLVMGESGTGKELVARGIHGLSPRRHKAFLAVNVAALTETLLESELFGHEKGSFTGAIDARKGFFELADKGTLFLDEIGEMPLSTQTKLLRVLEQREFMRVGGQAPISVDVRVIAATNRDLRDQVRRGLFRRDLFYRLNVLDIELPPLRRRREDIPRLVRHFVKELVERLDRSFPGISEEALELLVRYDWPGNVRELRNLIEGMVVLAPRRTIMPADLPREIRFPQEGTRLLPAGVAEAQRGAETSGEAAGEGETGEPRRVRPELEFIFRTLVDLRVDMDQLRRDFDIYQREMDDRIIRAEDIPLALPISTGTGLEIGSHRPPGADRGPGVVIPGLAGDENGDDKEADAGSDSGTVFRPGMTMEEMEQEAIRITLDHVGGNRRMAAETLGIGERTLYRKIQKYGLDV